MKRLNNPYRIILHTAAFRGPCDAKLIEKWHEDERGWEDIGYHFVVTGSFWDEKPSIQAGRDLKYQGAHARFNNARSIGICVTGHGDHMEWTEEQVKLVTELVLVLMKKYNISIKDVIGHRETLWERIKKYKTCPGNLIDMNEFRKHLALMQDKLPNSFYRVEGYEVGEELTDFN